MGFYQRFKSAFTKEPQAAIDYSDLGLTGSTKDKVSADYAMKSATVWACINLLSTSVASLPLRIFRTDLKGSREFDSDHPLYMLLAVSPNRFQSAYDFKRMMVMHLTLRGQAFARIYRNATGFITELVPIHPDSVSVMATKDNSNIIYEVSYGEAEQNGKPKTEVLSSDKILHLKGQFSDILTPVSPIAYMGRTINSEINMGEHQYSSFGPMSARPGGIIQTENPMSPEVAKRVLQHFNKKMSGPQSGGKTMLLDNGLQWKPVTLSNSDQEFLLLRRFSVEEITRVFGVPTSLISENTHSTFSNSTQQSLQYLTYALRPLCTSLEQAFINGLLRLNQRKNIEIDFDFSHLLRGTNVEQADYITKLVQGGVLTPNEARIKLGLDKKDEPAADSLYIQLNMSPIEDVSTKNETDNKTTELENEQNELMNNISKKLISEAVNE